LTVPFFLLGFIEAAVKRDGKADDVFGYVENPSPVYLYDGRYAGTETFNKIKVFEYAHDFRVCASL
jgi:hypothetical protein